MSRAFSISATFVVATSLYFLRVPLVITVPLAVAPWLVIAPVMLVHNALIASRQESMESRFKRWYGPHWQEELALMAVTK